MILDAFFWMGLAEKGLKVLKNKFFKIGLIVVVILVLFFSGFILREMMVKRGQTYVGQESQREKRILIDTEEGIVSLLDLLSENENLKKQVIELEKVKGIRSNEARPPKDSWIVTIIRTTIKGSWISMIIGIAVLLIALLGLLFYIANIFMAEKVLEEELDRLAKDRDEMALRIIYLERELEKRK